MGALRKLLIDYAQEFDLLAMGNGSWANGGGRDITSKTILTAFYADDGKSSCIGFDLFDAVLMLTPYLKGEVLQGTLCDGELPASYSKDTDTLILVSTQESITHNDYVADGLLAHCNKSGLAVGFTLKNASKLLLPHFQGLKARTGAVS